MNRQWGLAVAAAAAFALAACGGASNSGNGANAAANNSNSNSNANAAVRAQALNRIDRPERIAALSRERGEQDAAAPVLKIVEPAADARITTSIVKVKLQLSGDLKGYKPGMNEATHTGNHVHVILDNQPYEAYYNLDREFELWNVADGPHTLRVFPSRPWHESYKNDGAFQMVKFTVENGGATVSSPTTTNSGQQMSNKQPTSTPEGKQLPESKGGDVDLKKPLLTYSRPKGEYKGADAEAIMVDFWLSNAKLVSDGGEYRVRCVIDDGTPQFIDKWEPVWFSQWALGKHKIVLELVDRNGNLVDNGGYNSTTREFTVAEQ